MQRITWRSTNRYDLVRTQISYLITIKKLFIIEAIESNILHYPVVVGLLGFIESYITQSLNRFSLLG